MENNLILWILENYKLFLIVLLRISIFIFLLPFFSVQNVPVLVKTIFCVALTMYVAAFLDISVMYFPLKTFDYFLYLVIELFIGLTISLMLRSIMGGLQLAGQIAGFQMGLSMANLIDPSTGTQSVVITEFMYIIATLLFFITNGHHFLIVTIFDSFKIINPGKIIMNTNIVAIVLETS
jgi:flagellar biosynthetic protein FliR